MGLLDKLKKNSLIKETSTLENSVVLNNITEFSTAIPSLNIALGGALDGGLAAGLLQIAGPSKHFKSNMALQICSAFLKKYEKEDAAILFFDSEFGASKKYFQSAGIDPNRVIHVPITNIEELKFELMEQFKHLTRDDKLIIFIDSVGNLASKKEVDDASDGKSTTDMTRAKQIRSVFRMITPSLTIKNIPMIAINHIYMEQGAMYPKAIVSGGQGIYLSSNDVWIVGRSQEKVGTDIKGWTFTITIDKSRKVREKTKIPVTVMYDGGIKRESGLLDLALELGFLAKPSNGWYSFVDMETGELNDKKYRANDLTYEVFEQFLLNDLKFKDAVKDHYQFSSPETNSDEMDEYEGDNDE